MPHTHTRALTYTHTHTHALMHIHTHTHTHAQTHTHASWFALWKSNVGKGALLCAFGNHNVCAFSSVIFRAFGFTLMEKGRFGLCCHPQVLLASCWTASLKSCSDPSVIHLPRNNEKFYCTLVMLITRALSFYCCHLI